MKKLVVLLTLCLFASSAFAIIDESTNSLGIYFDLTADTVEWPSTGMVNAYLILCNPDFEGLLGYECQVDYDETTIMMGSFTVAEGGTNLSDAHTQVCGWAAPITCTPATLLGTWGIYCVGPIEFFLSGLEQPSLPGDLPCGANQDNQLVQFGCSAGPGELTACVACTGVVDSESETWGGVKSLYR